MSLLCTRMDTTLDPLLTVALAVALAAFWRNRPLGATGYYLSNLAFYMMIWATAETWTPLCR